MDRRTSIKWMLAASAAMPLMRQGAFAQSTTVLAQPKTKDPGSVHYENGYGTDPDLIKSYRPGDVWPLTFTAAQRRTAAVLCDLIIPEDAVSPSASSVGVVDFLDEWVSSPYPRQLMYAQRLVSTRLAFVISEQPSYSASPAGIFPLRGKERFLDSLGMTCQGWARGMTIAMAIPRAQP